MFDWNDVKALLAVARTGSTAGAARELGVNQTTVARRLESLERDLGAKLVERSQTGASLTEAGLCLVADGEVMERAAHGMGQRIAAHGRGVAGVLKITTSEMTANAAIMPLMPEFRRLHPDLMLELAITDDQLDLEAGEADVAIRGGYALADSNLVARKVSEIQWALYCSREYARRMGLPATPADLKDHFLIAAVAAGDGPAMDLVLRDAPGAQVNLKSTSMPNLVDSVRAGLGIGSMPCLLADVETDLIQVFPPHPEGWSYLWIVTRPELKDAPRVRAFIDFFAKRIAVLVKDLEDRAAAARSRQDGQPDSRDPAERIDDVTP